MCSHYGFYPIHDFLTAILDIFRAGQHLHKPYMHLVGLLMNCPQIEIWMVILQFCKDVLISFFCIYLVIVHDADTWSFQICSKMLQCSSAWMQRSRYSALIFTYIALICSWRHPYWYRIWKINFSTLNSNNLAFFKTFREKDLLDLVVVGPQQCRLRLVNLPLIVFYFGPSYICVCLMNLLNSLLAHAPCVK